MKVKFNNKIYEKNKPVKNDDGNGLGRLCFDIFKYYLEKNKNYSYEELQKVFNSDNIHKELSSNNSKRKVIFNANDFNHWHEEYKSTDSKSDERYFGFGGYGDPVKYNNEELYFTTQWGKSNIPKIIEFAKKEDYYIEVLDKGFKDKSKGKEMGNNVEYLINKFKEYLQDITIGLETNSQNRKFNVVLRNDNITAITNNNKELNIERDTRNSLKENNFTSRGGLSYAPVVAKYIKDNFLDNEESIKIKNIILYGSPGVGKTYSHKKLISLIEANNFNEKEIFDLIISNNEEDIVEGSIEEFYTIIKDEERMKFITFHQSFGYEDFIEGFRPNEDGDIKLQDGVFKTICDNANNDRTNKYYLVIDEINRGNISKIFGELITLIEEDKRDTFEVTLPYSKKPFKIPSNLYILGTMNSTDKSIALIDIALRRRFTFLKMEPNETLVPAIARNIFVELNKYISDSHLGKDYQIGHSYFMKIENEGDLEFVLEYKIKPLLEEYFYGDSNGYNQVIKIIDGKV